MILSLGVLVFGGCGSDDKDDDDAAGGAEAECDFIVEEGEDPTKDLQTAVIEASSGQIVCVRPGTYMLEKEIAIGATPGLTLRGLGSTRDEVILDFAEQTSGDDGMTATGDNFTIENMWIKNTPGNGIVVSGARAPVFRNLRVSWDRGPATENGAYAVYPNKCTDVLIEDCEVSDAADAGIYLGQSERGIVRRVTAYKNVIGIEVENSSDVEVYDNEAYGNTTGIFVPLLPNLTRKEATRTNIYNNIVRDNNEPNFGEASTVVSLLPAGTGIVLLNADDTRVFDNTITGNNGTGVGVVSQAIMDFAAGEESNDPESDPYPERTYIYGNTFADNGKMPTGILIALGTGTLEDVIWDGVTNPDGNGGEFCLGTGEHPSFRNFGGVDGVGQVEAHSTDSSPHDCTLPPLEPVEW